MLSTQNYSHRVLQKELQDTSKKILLEYLFGNNNDILKLYCNGKLLLPSPFLLQEISDDLNTKINLELKNLFKRAIYLSKLFYDNVTPLEQDKNTRDFENRFTQISKPIGQKLINILQSIKYKLSNSSNSCIAKGLYKISLIQVVNHKFVRRVYQIGSAIGAFLASVVSFIAADVYGSTILSSFTGVASGLLFITISIAVYPIFDFAQIDISGKNTVAYIYKAMFCSKKNKNFIYGCTQETRWKDLFIFMESA